MRNFRMVLAWVGCACVLAAAGCGGGAGLNAGTAGQGRQGSPLTSQQLPNPAALLKSLSGTGGQSVAGADFNPDLPHQRVEAVETTGVYSPVAGDPPRLPDMSYALYLFDLSECMPEDRVQLDWAAAPAAEALWLGLPDWDNDRWVWFSTDDPAEVGVPGLAGYETPSGELLALVLAGGAAQCVLSGMTVPEAVPDDWNQFGHDAQHTHRSPFVGPDTAQLKWKYEELGATQTFTESCAGPDGTLYVGSGAELFAINPDGSLKWRSEFCWPYHSAYHDVQPAVAADGSVYVASANNAIYALNSDGTIKWQTPLGNVKRIYNLIINPSGNIYTAVCIDNRDYKMLALSSTGTILWEYPCLSEFRGFTAGPEGSIYFANDSKIYVLNSDGTLRWESATCTPKTAPAVAADGTAYCGSISGSTKRLYALNADGSIRWQKTTPQLITGIPVIDSSGNIYVTYASVVAKFSPNGAALGTFNLEVPVSGQLALGADGLLKYFGIIGEKALYAVNLAGEEVWTTAMDFDSQILTLGPDGTLYASFRDEDFHRQFAAIDAEGAVQWQFSSSSPVMASPVLDKRGTVYVTSEDCNVYALSPSGVLQWTFSAGMTLSNITPAIGANGLIHLCSDYGTVNCADIFLYALNPDGSQNWNYQLPCNTTNTPVLGLDGTIYVGCMVDDETANMFGFNPDGTIKWNNQSYKPSARSAPVIGPDHTLYLGCRDGAVTAINPDGSLKWSCDVGSWLELQTSLALDQDGTVYVGSTDSRLYAINPAGTLKWVYETDGLSEINSSPALGADGRIYFGSNNGTLYAVTPEGTTAWTYTTGASIHSSPAIDGAGNIYFGSDDFNFYALDSAGSLNWSYSTGGSIWSAPAIGADGTVYVGSGDGKLYAFGPGLGN